MQCPIINLDIWRFLQKNIDFEKGYLAHIISERVRQSKTEIVQIYKELDENSRCTPIHGAIIFESKSQTIAWWRKLFY